MNEYTAYERACDWARASAAAASDAAAVRLAQYRVFARAVLAAVAEGMPDDAIAKRTGATVDAVRGVRRAEGVASPRGRGRPPRGAP